MLEDSAPIMAALRAADGAVAAAARRLKLTHGQLLYRIKHRPELEQFRAELVQSRESCIQRETARLIKHHKGNLFSAAKAAGVAHATFFDRVKKRGLFPLVEKCRPRPVSLRKEKEGLWASLRRHHGEIHKVAADLGVSKNTLRARLVKHHLVAEADALRAEYNLSGTRTELPVGRDFVRRRLELMRRIVAAGWNLSAVRRALKISSATFYKNLRILRIDRQHERRQHRLHQIIDALRKAQGHVFAAAATLRCTEPTLRKWCAEFELRPADYR